MTPTVRATVENALKQARMNLDRRVERPVKEFRMQTQVALKAAKELQTVGNLLEEATRIIITQNGSNFLSQIDNNEIQKIVEESNSVTKQKSQNAILAADSGCIKDDTDCQSRKNFLYRTITGICNNLNSPTAANANAPLRPFLGTQNYNDQISEIRRAVSGGSLPSPRLISNIMQKSTVEAIDSVKNNLIMQFGQMVAHDLVFGPSATGPNGEQLACDDCDSPSPNCAPIEVPADDEYFPKSTPTKKNCISFTRALNGQQGFGPRQPIGQTTHFLDLSIVYGSSLCEATDVRLFADGLLKTIQSTAGTLPPFDKNDTRCQSKDPFFCFKCGDLRSSFHPGLPPLHVMFVIEHNRIAREIKALKPTLNDETIYQTARRIMIAQYQHMVYNEYLPHIIGVNLYVSSKLKPLASGRTSEYLCCILDLK
ncbi:hypothetical protein WR25_21614 [Diploscapter pachys]|uniref:Heme peroxidase n=1 Tax=Diploscapter pachys TaxID=2018661 RepID=A0A2A2L3H2_9BILA|nr:hypothetical protein WR25_21614 [Diploscapter pachys]